MHFSQLWLRAGVIAYRIMLIESPRFQSWDEQQRCSKPQKKGLQEQQIFCILERMIGDHPTASRFVL